MRLRLTDLSIRKLPVPDKGQKTYFEGEGFGIRISQGGTRTFVQMYGQERKLKTLGRYPAVCLKNARKLAKAIQVAPEPEKRAQGLSAAVDAFLAAAENRCRPATAAMYRNYLNRLEGKNVSDVKKEDVTYSTHAMMSAKAFFNWCIREGLTDRNPVQFEKAKLGQRSRVLTDQELKLIWAYEHPPFSDHLKLLILTGQRRNQFSNYEVRGDTIFFPSDIMKGKADHTIPLLPVAQEVVERLKSHNGWSKQKANMDKAVKLPHWTIHDLRRTFATNMAKLGTPIHVTEKILAHRSGTISGIAAVYNRHDYLEEARLALANYEQHIQSVVA